MHRERWQRRDTYRLWRHTRRSGSRHRSRNACTPSSPDHTSASRRDIVLTYRTRRTYRWTHSAVCPHRNPCRCCRWKRRRTGDSRKQIQFRTCAAPHEYRGNYSRPVSHNTLRDWASYMPHTSRTPAIPIRYTSRRHPVAVGACIQVLRRRPPSLRHTHLKREHAVRAHHFATKHNARCSLARVSALPPFGCART